MERVDAVRHLIPCGKLFQVIYNNVYRCSSNTLFTFYKKTISFQDLIGKEEYLRTDKCDDRINRSIILFKTAFCFCCKRTKTQLF